MTPENFCYWLRGYIELSGDDVSLTPNQVKMINDHLDLVMIKTTPALETDSVDVDWGDDLFCSPNEHPIDSHIICHLTC